YRRPAAGAGPPPWVRSPPVPPVPPPRPPRRRRALAVAAAATATALLAGRGDDDPSAADERAEQVRAAAGAAGLPDDATEVLALAARGSLATYRVTYAGTQGAELIVTQAPPDQRVDVVAAGTVVESRVLRDGIAYRCELDD